MRLVCPRTTQRVLVVKNLIYDLIYQKTSQTCGVVLGHTSLTRLKIVNSGDRNCHVQLAVDQAFW